MSEPIPAVILSAGTELTQGDILNTHFSFLGRGLKRLGFRLIRGVQIPDIWDIFRQEMKRACQDAALVLITGGLGPTSDDLTREVAAQAAGVDLEFREEIWNALQKRFAAVGRRTAETNRKQAQVPSGFQILENQHGTAPGFMGRVDKAWVIALPGPPGELEPMFLEKVIPILKRELPGREVPVLQATALLIPESTLEEALQKHRQPGVAWGTRVTGDRILIRLEGGTPTAREQVYGSLETRFGTLRIRRDDVKPNVALFQALRERKLKLALAESCTGGLLGKLLTDIPGSSEVFWGGLVVYSNSAKEKLLGVDPEQIQRQGAVSREVASAMSAGLMARSSADIAVAVTGIAGPDGGTPEKPLGTVWISVSNARGRESCRRYRFTGSREAIRRRSCVVALVMAEALVLDRPWPA